MQPIQSRAESRALLVALVLASSAHAQQLQLFPNPVVDAPEDAAVAVGDVNGDALPDILTTNGAGATLALIGQGNGTFGEALVIHAGSAAELVYDLEISDVTGDGLRDIVALHCVYYCEPKLSVHAGIDADSYAAPVITPLPFPAPGLLTDLDMDGLADYVCLTASFGYPNPESHLTVARSSGTGTFELLQQVSVPQVSTTEPSSPLASGDFSQDGIPDLATTVLGGLGVFLGAGDGTVLDPPASWPFPGAAVYGPEFATADMDLDGGPDLIVAASTASEGIVMVLHWDAGFAPVVAASQLNLVFFGGIPTTGDVDGDGWPDVVVAGESGGLFTPAEHTLAVLMNDGTGGLLPPLTMPLPKVGLPRLVDLDGDNLVDLYCGASVHFSNGDGAFVQPAALEVEDPLEVVSSDMTGDGVQDLVVGLAYGPNYSQESLVVARGIGDGTFEQPQVISDDSSSVGKVVVGDVDGDNDTDVAIKDSAKVRILLNDGSGLDFTPVGDTLAPWVLDFEFGDLDGNGALDLVAAGIADQMFTWLGDGTGQFVQGLDVGLLGDGQDLSLIDLDQDGITDIAAAMGVSATVAWALGIGDGTFGTAQKVELDYYPSILLARDLNDDDLPDLVFAQDQGMQLDVLLADAPASYSIATEYALAEELRAIGVADVDVDGRPDLLVAAGMAKALGILLNLGPEGFGPEQLYLADKGAQSVATADFDGNGRPDVALACKGAEKVTIHLNLPSSFPNLGYQLPISTGSIQLVASGEPVPDQLVTLSVQGVTQPALGFLVLGLQFVPMPFHGGTLVPSTEVAIPMVSQRPLAGRWPELAVGTKIYAQAWFAVGREFAGTNAIFGATE